ncbi:MAG: hypothetical protein R2747_00720 [Pyrinomonadaceae bacterium]
MKNFLVLLILFATLAFAACEKSGPNEPNTAESNKETAESKTPEQRLTEDGFVPSGVGTEKEKPSAGKANVQGQVLFNEKPVEGIEVKLCEKFNTFSGCSGQQLTTKTDSGGEYLFKDVEPKVYEGLLARVFNTQSSIFISRSFGISAAKYKFEADKTFFAPATNLFKSDLKTINPKQKGKVDAGELEIKWESYPDAAYYKFSLYPAETSVTSPYIGERVEGESFKADKPLPAGGYRLKMEAYNANDVKLAESKDVEFTVTGGETAPANSEEK